MLPSFLIIGTQRAGTAPLFNVLRQHPSVFGPSGAHENLSWSRELHFFDSKYARGLNWYRSCFPLAASGLLARFRSGAFAAGEATSSYLFDPAVPARVAETLPEVRLIALLRNPVERAYWHHESNRRKGLEPLSFEEALAAEDERNADQYAYVARGLYADQLERWLGFFPAAQLLVLRAEDLAAQPSEVYAQVLAFLELAPWRPTKFPPVNWMAGAPIDAATRAQLEDHFAERNARLAQLLKRAALWEPPDAAATEAPGPVAAGPAPAP